MLHLETTMRRVIHPTLSRGHVADRIALILILTLVLVLVISVYRGVSSLALS